ncbi:MAG TPA: hypothetical protein VMS86_05455, partial [Thermoanaerobaculia bacterium]|nr:hypothetical protein [Thermoanaerobaculia bacterium]
MKTRVHPLPAAASGPLAMTLFVLCLPACSTETAGTEGGGAASSPPAVELTEKPAFPLPAHLESADIAAGRPGHGGLFEAGRLLFHTAFNGLDGVGMAKLPNGETIHRFALTPPGGILLSPASQSCGGCHNLPFPGGGGASHTHVAQDGDLDGLPPFNVRSTTSLFGNGILQLLAQEITEDLQAARDDAAAAAREAPGTAVSRELESKGVSYGAISATADAQGEVRFDLSAVEGVDPDLVVRPIGWKGNITTIRGIVMGAASIGMGMQAEEFVWRSPGGEANPDLDADGVTRE